LSVDITAEYQGLFGYISGVDKQASVNDLDIDDVNINGGRYVGAVAGYAVNAIIQNCEIIEGIVSSDNAISNVGGIVGFATRNTTITGSKNNAVVNSSGYRAGGIVGYISGGGVSNSENAGTVIGVSSVGGIAGYAANSFTIEGCNNKAPVTGTVENIAGIVGYVYYTGRIEGCFNFNTADIKGRDNVGGIVGYSDTGNIISRCYNGASITGGDTVGGIAGGIFNQSSIEYCVNGDGEGGGAVTGNQTVGGIVGETNSANVVASKNTGSVSGTLDNVGGVTGELSRGAVSNCYSIGQVNVPDAVPPYPFGDYVGGIVGEVEGGNVINCYSGNFETGNVYGDNYVGGITGILSSATVTASVVLGGEQPEVIGTGRYSGRISGYPSDDPDVYDRCYAIESMPLGVGGYDGENVDKTEAGLASFWLETLGWNPDIWLLVDDELPELLNIPQPPTPSTAFDDEDDEAMGIGGA
jgi:hypothetical protein